MEIKIKIKGNVARVFANKLAHSHRSSGLIQYLYTFCDKIEWVISENREVKGK